MDTNKNNLARACEGLPETKNFKLKRIFAWSGVCAVLWVIIVPALFFLVKGCLRDPQLALGAAIILAVLGLIVWGAWGFIFIVTWDKASEREEGK